MKDQAAFLLLQVSAAVADDACEGVAAVGVGGGATAVDGQRQAQQAKQVRMTLVYKSSIGKNDTTEPNWTLT